MPARSFSIRLSSPKVANAMYSALAPETGAAYEKRAKSGVQVKNDRLTFTIKALDAHAFEVSKDSFSRLVAYARALIE